MLVECGFENSAVNFRVDGGVMFARSIFACSNKATVMAYPTRSANIFKLTNVCRQFQAGIYFQITGSLFVFWSYLCRVDNICTIPGRFRNTAGGVAHRYFESPKTDKFNYFVVCYIYIFGNTFFKRFCR